MNKEVIKQNFDGISEKLHCNLSSEVRGMLYNIKSCYGLTNEDLAFFLDTNEKRVEDILSEYWDGRMSAKTFVKIQLLSLGTFGMPGCKMNDVMIDTMRDVITEYKNTKIQPKTRDEKVNDILSMLGVTNDDDLDRLINSIGNVRKNIQNVDCCCCDKQSADAVKCDCHNGNKEPDCSFGRSDENDVKCKCSSKECEDNQNNAKVSYYDSSKMSKPVNFSFDFTNPKDVNDVYKQLLNIISK